MRNLNTEEGAREFVSQHRKEQGLLKGGGAEQTSKSSKLGKAGKFAAGVAVAAGLLGLGSVGTARMMMAGGAQPNSNLYNPYPASYYIAIQKAPNQGCFFFLSISHTAYLS